MQVGYLFRQRGQFVSLNVNHLEVGGKHVDCNELKLLVRHLQVLDPGVLAHLVAFDGFDGGQGSSRVHEGEFAVLVVVCHGHQRPLSKLLARPVQLLLSDYRAADAGLHFQLLTLRHLKTLNLFITSLPSMEHSGSLGELAFSFGQELERFGPYDYLRIDDTPNRSQDILGMRHLLGVLPIRVPSLVIV